MRWVARPRPRHAPTTKEASTHDRDGSKDVFAHYSAIASSGFRSLNEGDHVEFETQAGPKGPQAANVTVLP